MPGYRSDNVIIAGGFNGEYAVTNTESREVLPYEGFVTHAYNGLVTHTQNFQDRRSGSLKAAFCSNDRRVRVMDVQTLRFTESFEYQTAINCAAMSPDGRLRALVGDSTEVLITDAERGGSLVTLQEHTDHIFACSWSLDGRHVATGGQDGRTVIWDPRNWSQPLRKLQSSMSCARSLHFTDAGCLVVAENEDVVKIYDARDFHSSQEMRFFGSIAGVALIDGGEEIAVANADKTVGGLLTFSRTSGGSRQPFYRTQARALMRPGGRWRYGKTPFRDVDSLTDLYI
jgi:WD40 repeat protein